MGVYCAVTCWICDLIKTLWGLPQFTVTLRYRCHQLQTNNGYKADKKKSMRNCEALMQNMSYAELTRCQHNGKLRNVVGQYECNKYSIHVHTYTQSYSYRTYYLLLRLWIAHKSMLQSVLNAYKSLARVLL